MSSYSLTSFDTPAGPAQDLAPLATGAQNARIDREVFDSNGFILPHHRTFTSLFNLFSRTYSYRWDEAIEQSRENAEAMKRDVFFRALLQERLSPLAAWKWSIKPEKDLVNPKDPQSEERKKVTRILTGLVTAIPRFANMRLYLGDASWHGRYGSQLAFTRGPVGGLNLWKVRGHLPVDGDKIQFDWDLTPLIQTNTTELAKYPESLRVQTDLYPALKLGSSQLRRRFVIHVHRTEDAGFFHPLQAGRVAGIGLRDFVYWAWFLRDELLSWMVSFMEKAGTLGILLFLYPEGNQAAQQQAETSAREVSNRSAIAVPVPRGAEKGQYGVQQIQLPITGLQFLATIIGDYFERHIERLFVGQSMSAGADNESGLGGSGRADFAKDTKYLLLKYDAENQAETLTEDLLPTFQAFNDLDAQWKYLFEYGVPDPQAGDKLEAITKAASLPGKKLVYKADDLRDIVGMTKPEDGDETVGGDDPQPAPGPGGSPFGAPPAKPGSERTDPPASPPPPPPPPAEAAYLADSQGHEHAPAGSPEGGRFVAKDHGGEGGGNGKGASPPPPPSPTEEPAADHPLAKAPPASDATEGLAEALPEEARDLKTWEKVVAAANFHGKVYGMLVRATPAVMEAIPEILDVAQDYEKITFHKNNYISDHFGIGANTAAVVASHVLARASVWVKRQMKGKPKDQPQASYAAEAPRTPTDEQVAFAVQLLAAMGIEPDEAKVRQMLAAKMATRAE